MLPAATLIILDLRSGLEGNAKQELRNDAVDSLIDEHSGGATTVTCRGRFDPAAFTALLTSRLPGIERGVLIDMEEVEFSVPSSAIRAAAWTVSGADHLLPAKVAFVAADDLAFGMLRMFVLFLGAVSDVFDVFMDHLSAIAWVTDPFSPQMRMPKDLRFAALT